MAQPQGWWTAPRPGATGVAIGREGARRGPWAGWLISLPAPSSPRRIGGGLSVDVYWVTQSPSALRQAVP